MPAFNFYSKHCIRQCFFHNSIDSYNFFFLLHEILALLCCSKFLLVKTTGPAVVITMVSSTCAAKLRSTVLTVQPSLATYTSYLPAVIIGSIANVMPSCKKGPLPGLP